MIPPIPPLAIDDASPPLGISPTDVSQFIRLDQCQRYLRLRLHERSAGQRFLRDYDVAPQSIPPILTRSGAAFEEAVEAGIAAAFPFVRFTAADRKEAGRDDDNAAVVQAARALRPGEVRVLGQPRLEARLGHWLIRGDVDLIRLERTLDGSLAILIADIKSSTSAKVEHRLQVAFYHEMLAAILADAGIAHDPIALAILYRGPAASDDPTAVPGDDLHLAQQRLDAQRLLGASTGLLETIADEAAYIGAVHDLVIGEHSTARRVLGTDFERIPFHLTYKCDGCLYNEFCMKQSAESDNLSLLPHLTEQDKSVLLREGITTVTELATLKDLRRKGTISIDGVVQEQTDLVPAPGQDARSRHLAATWPVGPRLDELVHRARRYRRWKGDAIEAIPWIPGKGYGSLPWSGPDQNPNLVRIFIDVQHDYLNDRLYMLGA
ncbi:MAG TPA: PD-(D/E)XK nuclease family protein, partial [Thermomicrobiales bacterium]|nr:PD-(D/E)XK nuclease family protein [Thermomicrobiales bacterium]